MHVFFIIQTIKMLVAKLCVFSSTKKFSYTL